MMIVSFIIVCYVELQNSAIEAVVIDWLMIGMN